MSLSNERDRVLYLDGLRGLAALSVVLNHLVCGFFPGFHFVSANGPAWQRAFATTPLFVFISGLFAVLIFFVLSGFVLSAVVDGGRYSLLALAPTRLLRLAVPAGISVLVAYILHLLGAYDTASISATTGHDWAEKYYREIGQKTAISELSGVYFLTGKSELNPVLWTMRVELIGSYMIYGLFALASTRRSRLAAIAIISVGISILGGVWHVQWLFMLCFTAGSALYELRVELLRTSPFVAWCALFLGLLFGGYPYDDHRGTLYQTVGDFFVSNDMSYPGSLIVRLLGSILIVYAVLSLNPLKRALETPVPQFLGQISFPLYLLHFPVLFALFSPAYLYLQDSPMLLVTVAIPALMLVLFGISLAIIRWLDAPLLLWLRTIRKAIDERRTSDIGRAT